MLDSWKFLVCAKSGLQACLPKGTGSCQVWELLFMLWTLLLFLAFQCLSTASRAWYWRRAWKSFLFINLRGSFWTKIMSTVYLKCVACVYINTFCSSLRRWVLFLGRCFPSSSGWLFYGTRRRKGSRPHNKETLALQGHYISPNYSRIHGTSNTNRRIFYLFFLLSWIIIIFSTLQLC